MNPQRRTYYGSSWYIASQLERDVRRLARDSYSVASETWIPGVRFLPAATLCLQLPLRSRHPQERTRRR